MTDTLSENAALRSRIAVLDADARGADAAFHAIADAVITVDANGHVLRTNAAAEALTGWSQNEMAGQPIAGFFRVISERSRSELEETLTRVLGEGVEVALADDSLLVAKDGAERPVAGCGAPIRGESGEVTGLVLVLRDQTEVRAARQVVGAAGQVSKSALVASEKRYRRLFEAAKDGILILDADSGRIVDVNPYLLELTSYSYDEIVGKHLWEIGPFKDIAASKDSFAELLSAKYVRYEDLPLKGSDGRKIDVEFVSNVYRVDGQNVIQCNIRDISARKQSEAERDRLATAIEQSAEMVVVTDADGLVVYANPAFEAVTGYARSEVLGKNPRLLKSGAQDADFYRTFWATISSGKTWHGRMVNRKKDGTLYTEDSSVSAVHGADGAITSFVAVKRDVTQELVLQAQFLQAQKMEGIGRLAGGVAHDFNNLLSVILSYVEIALEQLAHDDPLREDLVEVSKAGKRAVVLTRQLLAFGRVQIMQPVVLDLNQVAVGLEKMLRRILGEDIDLVQRLAPDLGMTLADPGQVEQILMNLAVNARDAMPDGGTITIETSNVELDDEYAAQHVSVKPGRYVQLAVTDSGCGMDERVKARLFEPFFTTKEKDKGTGLGLSTVYGIVKQCGGNIWVYSEPGQGTTFKVYLPRELAAAASVPARPTAIPLGTTGTETVLVVEDEEALRKVAGRSLAAAGYTVLTAADGDQALLKAREHVGEIHLLLTDVVMPRMSGRALAEALLATRPTLAILYMSGYSDEVIAHRGVLDPGTHFLGKPFTVADLTQKVREVLDNAPARS